MMTIGWKLTARAVTEPGLARALLIAVAALTAPTASHAQNMQKLTKVDIRLAPDLSMDETVRTEMTPLVESAVRSASQARWDTSGNLDVTLPDDVSAVRLPEAVEAKATDFSYQTRWSAEGHHLQVRTEIVSTVPTRVCSPEQIEAVRAAYRSI